MKTSCYFTLRASGFKNTEDKYALLCAFGIEEDPEVQLVTYLPGVYSPTIDDIQLYSITISADTTSLVCYDLQNYFEQLSKKYDCNIEVFSVDEEECGLQEHIIIHNGKTTKYESFDYHRCYLLESFEEFLENTNEETRNTLNITTKEDWSKARQKDPYIEFGGFGENWGKWTIDPDFKATDEADDSDGDAPNINADALSETEYSYLHIIEELTDKAFENIDNICNIIDRLKTANHDFNKLTDTVRWGLESVRDQLEIEARPITKILHPEELSA